MTTVSVRFSLSCKYMICMKEEGALPKLVFPRKSLFTILIQMII